MDPSRAPGVALVTGASTGIGRELARLLASAGYALVIAAEEPEIERVATELGAGGAEVVPAQLDLTRPQAVEELAALATGQPEPLTLVALNAGIGASGAIEDIPVDDDLRVVDLNVRSTVHLAKLTIPGMIDRGRGRVLFTSSIAADAPSPFHATYGASKAFVHSYAEALRLELQPTGVTVTSLKPGPTDTAFFGRAEMGDTAIGADVAKDSALRVAQDAYDALMSGVDQVVAGSRKNLLQSLVSSVVPDRVAALVASRQTKPGTASGADSRNGRRNA